MVSIPGGSVELRDARRGLERTVWLQPFEIAMHPVTAAEYVSQRLTGQTEGPPVAGVQWIDAIAWCNALSLTQGLEPAYTWSPEDPSTPVWLPHSGGYRLPTEAEWVYACRASSSGPRYGDLEAIGWSGGDAVSGPQPVGGKQPNAFGIYDTLGNVWEWCWDRLDPARYGNYRMFKGGGWADPAWNCRVGVRRGNAPDSVLEDVGFRVVRGSLADNPVQGWQGWSEHADRQRAAIRGPLPIGWTPLR